MLRSELLFLVISFSVFIDYCMGKIVLVTGGQSSGKSEFAEEYIKDYAKSNGKQLVYVATARVCDDEFRKRVERHQSRRGKEWINIEEEKNISCHNLEDKAVLVDCVTLWCVNYYDEKLNTDEIVKLVTDEFDNLKHYDTTIVFVSNEIGLGGVSSNALQRQFTDIQGRVNQYISSCADEVFFVVSGIPMKIK